MRVLEYTAVILLVVVFFVLLPFGMDLHEGVEHLELCAAESVAELSAEIESSGKITLEQYFIISELLYSCGYVSGLEVTEYYYEYGKDGGTHLYSISFEEIMKELSEEGEYRFRNASNVYLNVPGFVPEDLIPRLLFNRRQIEQSVTIG